MEMRHIDDIQKREELKQEKIISKLRKWMAKQYPEKNYNLTKKLSKKKKLFSWRRCSFHKKIAFK